MKISKLGAIDIGSNGVRLFIANVLDSENEEPIFSKSSLVRVPIRLGADVFQNGFISEENIARLSDSMKAFHLLMKVNKVEKYMACATSAMREASNNQEVTERIFKETGVTIRVIDGSEEAKIIASTNIHSLTKEQGKNYLYIDVGGGSTEFTIFSNGKIVNSLSFPIGTVRLLDDMVNSKTWKEVENWIKENIKGLKNIEAVGSGGNINKIFKNSGKKDNQPLTYKYLVDYQEYLSSFTYEERIRDLGFNPDRADVILYALRIYINAMKWGQAKLIHVPRIGLADGIVRTIYNEENNITY